MGYSMGLQRTLVVVISWWLPHGWSRGRPFALPELSPFVGVGVRCELCVVKNCSPGICIKGMHMTMNGA